MEGVTFSALGSTVAYQGTRLAGVPCLGRQRFQTVAAFLHKFSQRDALLVPVSCLHIGTVILPECGASLCQEDLACQKCRGASALAMKTMTLQHAERHSSTVCTYQQARQGKPVFCVASKGSAQKVVPSTAQCLVLCFVRQQAASRAPHCSVQ